MLKSVIFDMDGVIVDSHALHMRAWKQFLFSMGKPVPDADLEIIRDGRKREDILRHFLGDLTEDEIRIYGNQKELLFREGVEGMDSIPGVRQLLNELSRAAIPMAVASSGSSERVHYVLDCLRLSGHFEAVVTGDEVAIGKPDPAIFRKAAEWLKVRPTESLVFEDSVSGVRAASAAGMKCVGIANGHRANALLRVGADHVVPNFVAVSVSQMQKLFT